MGHGGCSGAGMPCEDTGCRYSIKRTGLVCPSCRQATATIETQTNRVIGFRCPPCGYRWRAEKGRVAWQRKSLQ